MELDLKNTEVAVGAVDALVAAELDAKAVEGIDPCFHDAVRKYGRPMFCLVMNSGMAREALGVMVALAQKHASQRGMKAAEVLAQSAGQLATDYALSQGWAEAELQQCDRDLQMAWASRIAVPGSSIILPH